MLLLVTIYILLREAPSLPSSLLLVWLYFIKCNNYTLYIVYIQYICWYNILLCWKKNFTLLLNLMGFLRGGYRFKNKIARGLHKKVGIRLRYTYTTHCKFPKNTEFIAVIAVSNIAVFGISTVTSNMSVVVILFTIRLLEIMTSK